ncbi:flagellar biosynthetic protein FliR [Planomonospora sp. ID82291]|uniref:flagellar biosynthetic protein FliR n=1 Tax=Planomonospora sp. ID82291 TaxID=2738136 RepID=UPI0018C3733D|nr:flagellar biosynthetic protein FliR [Planomonospora sp. ID82291]MBG0818497.1 flagellar biosynthetic protein FliR [Planomonospora sp. ID82291]
MLSQTTLVALLLASVRSAAWLLISPPFNNKAIPGTVKALLSVAIALPMAPALAAQITDISPAAMLVVAAEQAVVGVALGFLTAMVFAAVQAAGDLLDIFGGFSLATAFDPMSMSANSVFGKFYGLLCTTLLLVSGGYQFVLLGFTRTYRLLPLDGALSLETLSELVTGGLADLFVSALQIAGPIIAVLFVADLALGLLSKAAPALNAFSLGFPVKIFLTLALAGIAISVLPGVIDGLTDRAVRMMTGLANG